ncbi:hypothetical protein ACERII_21270 [Evansella sp. AB-rgal1]|uniref:hypothetical protein n=1 Tax=Evansella sp. AB-rgal1 TaxID=3242696 RepID=UPI00359EC850
MYQLLSSSVERIKNSPHMSEMLGKSSISVCVICEDEQWLVIFRGRDIEIESVKSTVGDVVIEGDLEAYRLLLNGEDFLLSMKRRGELGVSGNLKDLLLLESLWYLSKSNRTTK